MARVLVIDDAPGILNLWARALSQDGHVVFKAAGIEDAERVVLSEDLDVIVIDLVVPEGDGLALIGLARSVRPRVRILAVAGGPACAQAIAAGADATMAKPLRTSDLRSAVSGLREQGRGSSA